MLRCLLMLVFAGILVSSSAFAAKPTEKEKCLKNVAEITTIKESDETPRIGEKAEEQLEGLVEIATHLCQTGNFVYAEKLLVMARGMLASE